MCVAVARMKQTKSSLMQADKLLSPVVTLTWRPVNHLRSKYDMVCDIYIDPFNSLHQCVLLSLLRASIGSQIKLYSHGL